MSQASDDTCPHCGRNDGDSRSATHPSPWIGAFRLCGHCGAWSVRDRTGGLRPCTDTEIEFALEEPTLRAMWRTLLRRS
jgi:hypothetical protein